MAFTLYHRATIVCDNAAETSPEKFCVAHEEFQQEASECSLDTFSGNAAEHFESLGWQMYGNLCPRCKIQPVKRNNKKRRITP